MKLCGTKKKYNKQQVAIEAKQFYNQAQEIRYPYKCCICGQYHLSSQLNLIDEPLQVIGALKNIFISAVINNKTYNIYRISAERALHHVKIDNIKYGFTYNKQTENLILYLMIDESEK
jgi:hypothetical protein